MLCSIAIPLLAAIPDATRPTLLLDVGDPRLYPLPAVGHWNGLGRWDAPWPQLLSDLLEGTTGVPTAVSAELQSPGPGRAGAFFHDHPGTHGEDAALLDDLLDLGARGATAQLVLEGLPAGWYEVVTFAWAPDDPGARTRVRVEGALEGAVEVGGPWPGALVEGRVFARHRARVDRSGRLAVHLETVLGYGSLNGVRLTPIDAPCPESKESPRGPGPRGLHEPGGPHPPCPTRLYPSPWRQYGVIPTRRQTVRPGTQTRRARSS